MNKFYQSAERSSFFLFIIIISLLIYSVVPVHAQTPPPTTEGTAIPLADPTSTEAVRPPGPSLPDDSGANTPGVVNCFDYYTFGSVEVDAAPTLEESLPGQVLPFSGTIVNNNPYPIVDGQVYVKIFKEDTTSDSLTKQNGDPLVDFFLAEENVVLPANNTRTTSFDWKVPEALGAGNYTAAFYFTTAHRYNLLGLSFTDDVTGNIASFRIGASEEGTDPVAWNKNAVTLNDTDFRFAAYPPHFAGSEPVTAHTELVNPSDEQRIVTVTWITSKWDGILNTHEVKREKQGYALKPREVLKLSYTPMVFETSVVFLQAIVQDRDAQSIMHIRFVRDGFQETRINFPSIMKFPLKAGEETTIFSCLHSTNLPIVTDNVLTLTLKDKDGNVVHTYTYTGDVTGSMMGVKDTFTPPKNLSNFSLTAMLTHKGVPVDLVTQKYNCTDIDEALCLPETEDPVTNTMGDDMPTFNLTWYTIGAGIAILLLLGLFVFLRRKGSQTADTANLKIPEPYDTNI